MAYHLYDVMDYDCYSDDESTFSREDRLEEDRNDAVAYVDDNQTNKEEEEFFRHCHTDIPILRQEEAWSDEDIIYKQVEEMYPFDKDFVDERYDHSKWNVQCYPECEID